MLSSIRKLVGRGTLWLPWPASESCPLPRSGTVKDFGVDGSEENIVVISFDEGSKILTNGLVISPNTCKDFTNVFLSKI